MGFEMPMDCNPFHSQLCDVNDTVNDYIQCTKCQCLNLAQNSCLKYVNNNESLSQKIRKLTTFIYFFSFYARQLLALWLIACIGYKSIYHQCNDINEENENDEMELSDLSRNDYSELLIVNKRKNKSK